MRAEELIMITMKSNELIEKLTFAIDNEQPFKIEATRSYHGRFGTYNGFYATFIKESKSGECYRSPETLDSRSKKKVIAFLRSKGFEIDSNYDATNWKFNYKL